MTPLFSLQLPVHKQPGGRNRPQQLVQSELISLQEKERQRLESLRKKQEAEEQRKKKMEEEKRRRQAEMKQ